MAEPYLFKTAPRPRLRLRVSAAAENRIRSGHPWVFAGSLRDQNRDGLAGELAVLYDRHNQFLAAGLFDPASPIRVRVLHTGQPATFDAKWWATRLEAALRRRDGLFDTSTTGFRLLNGESDGWPGLVLDRYDTTLVLKLYTAAWLPGLRQLVALIHQQVQPERIVLRLSRHLQHAAKPSSQHPTDGEILWGPALRETPVFLENGLRFEADVLRGQKTGFFLDQRENRQTIGALAPGRDVLNAFSFSGGFSVYAARGGARSVTDLDISAHALAAARRNFQLNLAGAAVARCCHECVQADAFEWLADPGRRRYGLIVLDPPSLAKRETERTAAIRAYTRLAGSGISRLARHGLLLACSCSAHVSAEDFFAAVRRAAIGSGRRFVEIKTTGHAPDHPATFREAHYLKGIYLKFS